MVILLKQVTEMRTLFICTRCILAIIIWHLPQLHNRTFDGRSGTYIFSCIHSFWPSHISKNLIKTMSERLRRSYYRTHFETVICRVLLISFYQFNFSKSPRTKRWFHSFCRVFTNGKPVALTCKTCTALPSDRAFAVTHDVCTTYVKYARGARCSNVSRALATS